MPDTQWVPSEYLSNVMLASSRGIRESSVKLDWNACQSYSTVSNRFSCFSSCSFRASSPPVNMGYAWPDASWLQMEQRRLGRMEQYSQASWECPIVPVTQFQEFLSTLLLLYLIGKGEGTFGSESQVHRLAHTNTLLIISLTHFCFFRPSFLRSHVL